MRIENNIHENQEGKNMKAEKIPVLIGMVLIVLLAFLIIWKADILGVSESRMHGRTRESRAIGRWLGISMRTSAPCFSMTRTGTSAHTPSI